MQQAGGQMITVSADSVDESRKVVSSDKLAFDLVADPDLALIGALGLVHADAVPGGGDASIPATYLVNRDGTIVWRHVGKGVNDRPSPAQMIEEIRKLR